MNKVLIGITGLLFLFFIASPADSGLVDGADRVVNGLRMRPVALLSSQPLAVDDVDDSTLYHARALAKKSHEKSDLCALPLPVEVPNRHDRPSGEEWRPVDDNHTTFKEAEYQFLQKTLRAYDAINRTGGWPKVEPGPPLRVGDQGPRVKALRSYLRATGDLPTVTLSSDPVFDRALESAVMRFQGRHGLFEDGVVGKNTQAAIAVPVEERINQLQINMERWRSIPGSFGSHYLMVNIPGFELRIVENDTVVRKMRAIVGKKRRQTPVMSDRITYVELNPYWNIPRRIVLEDILPRIQEDPGYLAKHGIRVFNGWKEEASVLDPVAIDWGRVSNSYFPYRLRQEPSKMNSLGQVKFMFPNRQSVYIHDTPGKNLFQKQKRAFSSGCVRVQDPLALAEYLIGEQDWDRKRLETTIEAGRRQVIVLKKSIPVHLVYFTAWVDEGGDVHFREDIYDIDKQFLANAQKGPSISKNYSGEPGAKNLFLN